VKKAKKSERKVHIFLKVEPISARKEIIKKKNKEVKIQLDKQDSNKSLVSKSSKSSGRRMSISSRLSVPKRRVSMRTEGLI